MLIVCLLSRRVLSESIRWPLSVDDQTVDVCELPGGAVGTADIYTEQASYTHIIRHVELRMKSWLNYLVP